MCYNFLISFVSAQGSKAVRPRAEEINKDNIKKKFTITLGLYHHV